MCLILAAIDALPGQPLLLLGNRDEFHGRVSAPAAPWDEDARVAGGRDLVAGGSWLAARSDGRFAVVTNVRSGLPATAPRSRGALVRDFVLGDAEPAAFLAMLGHDLDDYGPFNLIVGVAGQARLLSSTGGGVAALAPGVHVISNGAPGVHWPKTQRLQQAFANWRADPARTPTGALDLLLDTSQPAAAELPDTGVGHELERTLAPIFVRGAHYGTRAGTLLACAADGSVLLRERRFGANGLRLGEDAWRAARNAPFARVGVVA
ncbi:NRDE family protein [Dokdonella sp.]|uniref:NRDE family protein n=1 Tax=Dokdonella sp. TaxID=2291710 RepID=UPI0027BA5302|nr:NRDE family protein [Dokdonella sp.]